MDMQNVSNLQIPEGAVRTIHDKDSRLIWGRVAYNTKYAGDTYQQTYSGKNKVDGANPTDANFATASLSNNVITISSTATGTIPYARWVIDNLSANDVVRYSGVIMDSNGQIVLQYDNNGTWTTISGSTRQYTDGTTPVTYAWTNTGNTTKVRFLLYANKTKPTSSSSSHYKNVILTVNNSDLSYEPFVGGTPAPNPSYPQPIQVVTGEQTVKITGKNLFPTVSQTSSSTGITTARNSDGTYNISGTATSEFNAISWVEDLSAFADGQTYTLSVSEQVGDLLVLVDMYNDSTWLRSFPRPGGTTLSQTAALDLTNATKVKFSLRVRSGKTVNLTNLAVQFERGAATDYEPYHLQSYTVNLGKNLFDKYDVSTQLPNTYINTTGVLQAGTNAGTVFAKCQPNATYTVSKSLSARFIIGETATLPADDVTVSNIVRDDTATHLTITTGPTAQYIVVFCHHSSDTMTLAEIAATVQIEAGSVATEYAPYFPPVELCKIGDYQDYIYKSGDDWYVHKACGEALFNGTENWEYFFSAAGVYINRLYIAPLRDSTINCISDHFIGTTRAYIRSNLVTADGVCSAYSTEIVLANKDQATIEGFKTWLSTHNTILYYALATPTDTKITDATLVGQLNDVHQWLTRYGYNATVAGDLPIVLQRDSLQ